VRVCVRVYESECVSVCVRVYEYVCVRVCMCVCACMCDKERKRETYQDIFEPHWCIQYNKFEPVYTACIQHLILRVIYYSESAYVLLHQVCCTVQLGVINADVVYYDVLLCFVFHAMIEVEYKE
jgi:hypothetical protein